MKRWLALISLCLALPLRADRSPQEAYVARYADIAVREMKRTGVPASITLAQGLVESDAGRSTLATKGNNHFGIKCHNGWKGRTMRRDDDARRECFRVYKTPEASFRDHSDFLRYRDRYKSLFDLETTDYKGWAHGLKAAGYATDPAYAAKLIRCIEEHRLYRYDVGMPRAELPAPPLAIEAPQPLSDRQREVIRFAADRPVAAQNGVPFVRAVRGDTFRSLARDHHLFLREILRFNDVSADRALEPGETVYLAAKKRRAPAGLDMYVADRDGESLWEVSQRFGVRLSAICKMNGLAQDGLLHEGDGINLR